MAEEINNQEVQPEFHIQRVYTKDVSFEAPNTPHIFQKEWQPDVKLETETAFLCEVQQAGIFTIGNLPEPQLAHCLAAFCPNILFPYAREAVANLVSKGSFPQLNLAPVNFDALFAQHMAQAQAQQATAEA